MNELVCEALVDWHRWKNQCQCQFVHHKSDLDWSGNEEL